MTVLNPRFETAAASGEPGAAEDWTWTEYADAPAWALFEYGDPLSIPSRTWLSPEEDFTWTSVRQWLRSGQFKGTIPTRDLSYSSAFPVSFVVMAPTNIIVLTDIDARAMLPVGGQFRITGSTGLDSYWTVVSAVLGYNPPNGSAGFWYTAITVAEDVLTSVADGAVELSPVLYLGLTGLATQPIQFWPLYFEDETAATIDEIVDVMREYTQHCEVRVFDDRILVAHEIASAIHSTGFEPAGEIMDTASYPLAPGTLTGLSLDVTVGGILATVAFTTETTAAEVAARINSDLHVVNASAEVYNDGADHIRIRARGNAAVGTASANAVLGFPTCIVLFSGWVDDLFGFDDTAVFGIDGVDRIADLDTVAIAATFGSLRELAEAFDWYGERFETLEDTGAIGAEFLSWYECLYGVASPRVLPSDADAFEEGWGTDPMSDPANRGYGCWPVDGNVYGAEIDFPISISATRNLLYLYDGRIPSDSPTGLGNVVCLTITPGVYGDAMDICAELYTRLSGSGIVSNIAFSFRGTDPARSALSIGWNGNPRPGIVGLCQGPAPLDGKDCRATLGLDRLGGKSSAFIEVPTAYFDGPPPAAGWAGTPFYRIDVNGVFFWNTMADPDGGRVSLGNGESIAKFDYSIFRTNIVEKFIDVGWGGVARIEASDVETTFTYALFTGGLDYEDFEGSW